MAGNLIIGQSGGPTAVINASLAGALREAMASSAIDKVYGMRHGMQGFLNGEPALDLGACIHSEEDLRKLAHTPAMALGSCRYKLPPAQDDPACYEKIAGQLAALDVSVLLYIGGNDSMDTVQKLSAYFASISSPVRVVGVPKTIDNDLAVTDHSPGFGSAAKYIACSIMEIAQDAAVYDLKSLTVVEIMGRDAGWLAAASTLARRSGCTAPHLVYLPEAPFDAQRFVEDVRRMQQTEPNVIAAVSEGLRAPDGSYAAEAFQAADRDVFGHKTRLSGAGRWLTALVKEQIGCKTRAIELNVLQRCAAHLLSGTDQREAYATGANAVRLALDGKTGVASILRRVSSEPYAVVYESAPVEKLANVERCVPREWITPDGCDVTAEMKEYLAPLITGEFAPPMNDVLPDYFHFPI